MKNTSSTDSPYLVMNPAFFATLKSFSSSAFSSYVSDSDAPYINICGEKISAEQILLQLKSSSALYQQYLSLSDILKQEFLDFCTGNAGLKISYDPFFKFIFDSYTHPERLSRFLSCIMKRTVKVKHILPTEGNRTLEGGSLLILDILVELEDGTLTNVEIQKIAYKFPGERIDCYSSDLLLRQYSRIRSLTGKKFNYNDLKPVYTIVLYEKNREEFLQCPHTYIHQGQMTYDSGLKLNHLQKSIIIALDIFKKNTQTIVTELDAWLFFLCSDDPVRIWEIQDKFPFFKDLYRDIFNFRENVGEVLNMFSEALRIMDHNTQLLMIDELKEELEETRKKLLTAEEEASAAEKEVETLKAKLAQK